MVWVVGGGPAWFTSNLARTGAVYRHLDASEVTMPLSIATRDDGATLQARHFLDCAHQAAEAETISGPE